MLTADLEGVVNAGTAGYLESAVEAAEGRCDALLVRIDTPGGMLEETRRIVRAFLGAEVPIVTYVGPSGARAGSAGVFITMAGHVAAMAPGTNIGAAHPVTGQGKDPEEAGGEHMAKKVENDTAAFARSIAEQRGRNAEWAEKAVRESVSITASEALEQKVIDHVAESDRALLRALDGTTVTIGGEERALGLAEARLEPFDMTISQRALTILGHPTLAYILLMIGALGIMIEVYNPGLIIPGAIGGFALLLAAIGLNALPVNVGAIILVVLALALFVTEAFTPTFGLLTAGGLASLLVGAALLVDESDPDFFVEPSVRVSWGAVVPLALVIAGAAFALAWNAARYQRQRSPTGREGLEGERGKVVETVGPDGGAVQVHGERWNAHAAREIPPGTFVRVLAVDGLRLEVKEEEDDEPRT